MEGQRATRLIDKGTELFNHPKEHLCFTGIEQADKMLNDLYGLPHAFVLACLMDRGQKAERCWLIPYEIKERIGSFDFDVLKTLSAKTISANFRRPKPLHRYVETMADVFYNGIQRIAQSYNGDASGIWSNRPGSAAIVRRFLEFEGVAQKIATMAANILVRDFKVKVTDRYSIDISVDVHIRRVFTRLGFVPKGASNEYIIYKARELNPDYPGVFDLPCWEIGRTWCKPKTPQCPECYMIKHCPTTRR